MKRNPLYRQIADILRNEIKQTKASGERLDSESSIAARFKVTVMTVREALRVLRQQGWIERRRAKGSFVADIAAKRNIAILSQMDLTHPAATFYHRHIAHVLRKEFDRMGYASRFFIGNQSPLSSTPEPILNEFIQELKIGALAGIVAINTMPDSAWMDLAMSQHLPVIGNPYFYEYGEGANWDLMVEMGVHYLIGRGCRRIAFFEWQNPVDDKESKNCKRDKFVAALKAAGIEPREGWMRGDLNPHLSAAGWEGFREIWTSYEDKPDGIFFADDMLFKDAITAILELGIRVPQDLTVLTHANKGMNFSCPFPVTRLEFDPEQIAINMANIMVSLLSGEVPSIKKRFCSFSVIESVGLEDVVVEPEQMRI